ncbi:MAG: 16S rRNA (cytosine(1402)-N(4))-methyltransferase RsmH [Alphaproteobacteria bacterium]|nr:16S rRNA (cytosine(1402)-N(4))-methyltransferase RsmH [Alphaproteobacteria bacterium]
MQEHISVMLKEVLEMLAPQDERIYFDGTFGGGGYTKAILEATNCRVIASDRDSVVIPTANKFKEIYKDRFDFSHSKFSDVRTILSRFNVEKIDGAVLDLGVSNFQLSNAERGFSFREDGPLSMEMGLCEESAFDVIRNASEQSLANIIYELGEERFSRRIAKNIKKNLSKIHGTKDLADVIHSCVPRTGKTDSATKTFQALRIFVNKELEELRMVLHELINLLNPQGKIIVVSFHSLEDRIVKLFFKEMALSEDKEKFQLITKKPLVPSDEEILFNPKSRSAKLRGLYMIK